MTEFSSGEGAPASPSLPEKPVDPVNERESWQLRDIEKSVTKDDTTLTKATIHFHTKDDDKDNDTLLAITMYSSTGRILAFNRGYFDCFHDWRDNDVDLICTYAQWQDFWGGWLALTITPNGNDTWRFAFEVELNFTDSSTGEVSTQFPIINQGYQLDEDHRSARFDMS